MVHIFTIERLATSRRSRRDDACIIKRQFMTFSDQYGLVVDGFCERNNLAKAPYQFQKLRNLISVHRQLAAAYVRDLIEHLHTDDRSSLQ